MGSVDHDFDRVIGVKELKRITAGQVRVYHVGNLASDRGLPGCPNKPIDRAANVALDLSRRGTAALFQRRLDENKFEYLIMGVGFMPALQNPPTSREIKQ